MCTAITYKTKDHYFGRTLDIECSYGEQIAITPRSFPFEFRMLPKLCSHYAMIGMAAVIGGYPLYYEATNEHGLSIAGLNFPKNAHYFESCEGKDNVAPFELIPYILGKCKSLDEAKGLLENINIVNISFSEKLPLSPLHWIIADKSGSITLECTQNGMKIYDNPIGVLTNNPTFDYQMTNLRGYLNLTPLAPNSRFSEGMELLPYGEGMGSVGLPGDFSPTGRFVRAAFVKLNSVSGDGETESVNQFFHILGAVEMPRGSVRLSDGACEITEYTSCCNTDRGIYYYTTYENRAICAVDLQKENLDSNKLALFPLVRHSQITLQN